MNLSTSTIRLDARNYHGSFRRYVLSLLTQFSTSSRTQFEHTVLKSECSDYQLLRQLNIMPAPEKGSREMADLGVRMYR